MIEQMQPSNFLAASTIKMLQLANTNSQAVYLATSNNWSAISSHLVNYSSLLSTFSSETSEGYEFLLPQNGAIQIAGSGSWTGTAFVERYAPSDNYHIMGMAIGQDQGGYAADLNASINTSYTQLSVQNQPSFFITTPPSTPAPLTADPVDTADDTYQVLTTDLSLGQAEPKGISLSRYYNGTRRLASAGGMTGGWINNYCVTANNVAAPQAGLGQTTPAQMASMLVASSAILAVYNGDQPDPKNWMVSALIAKWGIDQLIKNGVSVNLGKDTLQFVQQPNGVFTPPANCTSTLTTNGFAYALHLRHGNTFRFNSSGYLTNIVDQYSNSLSLTYTSSNWVQTVKDWKNRTLTFTYNGSPVRLASISDGTRTVHYGYSTAYSSQGDLTSFTNTQGNVTTYQYNTNHDIVATLDAQNRMVVSNVYNAQDQITSQYVEGNVNKMWLIDWTGFTTTEFDPAGDKQIYSYDDQGRLISTEDALGNLTQTFYDGQNHIIETISPLDETNLSVYDGNNNLVETVDPLNFTNQFIYDGNNNLAETIDPRGNVGTFGYNAEFSVTGQTNGAGDWVNYAYNGDGTLHTRTDSGGTATYAYDSFGQLSSVAYPGISTNTFVNSYAGDVTNHVDGRGFATAYQYNALRQLTNTIAPTNLIAKTAYDPEGNQASATDPRGNVTSQSWSATRKQLSTTFPAMAAGTPIVTNLYDNRDWLTGTLDPLRNETFYANDPNEHLISETDPVWRTTTLGYDADGRQLAVTNAASEATYQTWDAKSELTALIDGAGHISTRAYDGAGDQIVLTNRNSNPWHFYFDGANRLTNTVSPLGRSTTVVFNHQGLPSQFTDPLLHITTNSYDAKGRLTNRSDNVATTFYRYDADDNLTNISENGLTNSWTFDAYDRASSYRDVFGNVIQYRYDANGNLTNLVYPGGRTVYYSYDSNNNMTNVTDWTGRKTRLTYDLDGHLTGIYRPNGTYRTISYDSAGEITNILEQMANGLPIAMMRYHWDLAARMSVDFIAPLPHTNSPLSRSMTYDADNELETVDGNTVSVDSDGNLLSGPLTNDTFATYTYDARNRLLNVGGVTNYYDAANDRIAQAYGTNSVEYVVNPNSALSQVLERIKNGNTTYYIYGPGLLYQIVEAPTATNTLTYHYDYRGSTTVLTGDSGLVTDRMEYSLYGTMTYRAGTNDAAFLFAGFSGCSI